MHGVRGARSRIKPRLRQLSTLARASTGPFDLSRTCMGTRRGTRLERLELTRRLCRLSFAGALLGTVPSRFPPAPLSLASSLAAATRPHPPRFHLYSLAVAACRRMASLCSTSRLSVPHGPPFSFLPESASAHRASARLVCRESFSEPL